MTYTEQQLSSFLGTPVSINETLHSDPETLNSEIDSELRRLKGSLGWFRGDLQGVADMVGTDYETVEKYYDEHFRPRIEQEYFEYL